LLVILGSPAAGVVGALIRHDAFGIRAARPDQAEPPGLATAPACGSLASKHATMSRIDREEPRIMQENSAELDLLSGVRVVDFTQFEAGPSSTEALAWLGAEVVKIENPRMGDPGRRLRPGQPDDDPYYFHVFNANKKSITLNLKSPRGLALVKNMLRKADVCVENFAPGTIERLGLGYDVVRELNPGIIYAQVKGFGEGSPFEHNLAFDMIAQACGGTFSVTGMPDGPPVRPGISLGDTGTGMLMAITILGALRKRDATGQGRRLQVAMQDAMLHYMRINFATQGLTGKPAQRGGGKVPGVNNAPMGLYACKPGGSNDYVYLMTSRANPDHWDRLLKLIGREDLIGDARYATPMDRLRREPEVDAIIAQWTRHHTKHEAMQLIGAAGIPAGAVLDTMELQNDPSFEQRGIMQVMHHPVHGDFKMPAWPVRVDGKPSKVVASPVLGQHTAEVLGAWLGMSEADVEGLKRDGAI
jgi:crotonobetainyl-CoA:carnitine CoA-transferase CaiB-like acyl-CoA transferase